jgi:hypothetical protein
MQPALIAKLNKIKFLKHRFTFCFCCTYFGQHEVTELYQIILLRLLIFWQCEVLELLSNHYASVAHVLCKAKSLTYYQIIVLSLHVFLATPSHWRLIKSLCFGYTIFGNVKSLSSSYQIIVLWFHVFWARRSHWALIKSLYCGCMYFWQHKVTKLLSSHCASVARIFYSVPCMKTLEEVLKVHGHQVPCKDPKNIGTKSWSYRFRVTLMYYMKCLTIFCSK